MTRSNAEHCPIVPSEAQNTLDVNMDHEFPAYTKMQELTMECQLRIQTFAYWWGQRVIMRQVYKHKCTNGIMFVVGGATSKDKTPFFKSQDK